MIKTVSPINFEYIYSPVEHKGAPYSLDGEHWFNHGDLCEIADKSSRNLPLTKDANTPYDKGSDINDLRISCKSSHCTLVNKVLGYDYESVKAMYFATCHSTTWDYITIINDEIIIYTMDKEEFSKFMDAFAGFAKDRKTIRFKNETLKMLKWLDERV